MAEKQHTSTDTNSAEKKAKRPYERPQIIWRDRIEARAVTCARLPSEPGCGAGPITS